MGPYKQKADRLSWSIEDMEKAIQALRTRKMGLKKACREYNVPRTTLQRRYKSNLSIKEAASKDMVRKYQRKSNNDAYGETALKDALEALSKGVSYKDLRLQYGVSRSVLERHRDGKVSNPGFMKLCRFGQVIETDQDSSQHLQEYEIVNDLATVKEEMDSLHCCQVFVNKNFSEIASYSSSMTVADSDSLQHHQDCTNYNDSGSISPRCSFQPDVEALSAIDTLRQFLLSHSASRTLNESLDSIETYVTSLSSNLNKYQIVKSEPSDSVTVFPEADIQSGNLVKTEVELDRHEE